MSDPIFFAPLKVPVTDASGLMNREWYLFFQAMYMRIGGVQAFTPDDLQLIGDVSDATDDGNDIRASTADLERALALDEPQIPTDLSELQALSASFAEDPIIARFTAQYDGLIPASGGGTAKFMRADGAWAVPAYPTVPVGANPSASVGLAAVNGSAATFMTSDSAPPLSQAISPTWTNPHIFSAVITASVGIRTYAGVTASTASGTPVSLQALPNTGYGTYLVSAAISGANDAGNYSAVSLVCTNGTVAKIIALQTAGLLTITLSGATVQATQGSGAPNTITYSILRLA